MQNMPPVLPDSLDVLPVDYDTLPVIYDVADRKKMDVRKILQPKTVTYARYKFSKIHYHLLVRIREELSAYVTNNIGKVDPRKLVRIPLYISDFPNFHGNMRLFYSCIRSLMQGNNVVDFKWTFDVTKHADVYRWMNAQGLPDGVDFRRIPLPEDGAQFQQSSVIIVNVVRSYSDLKCLLVDINPVLFPFLLYYGNGMGGTIFDRDIALSLNSSYSCRLYELIMDWSTSGPSKILSIEEFRKLLMIPDGYSTKDIRTRVLDVAMNEISESGSDLQFEYRLKYDPEYGHFRNSSGPIAANCVVFTLNKRSFVDWNSISEKQIRVLLQTITDREKSHLCEELARRIVSSGQASKIKSKFFYYDGMVSDHAMTPAEYRNTMLKIVREMTGTDLRSESHIRYSARASKKYRPVSSVEPTLFGDLTD